MNKLFRHSSIIFHLTDFASVIVSALLFHIVRFNTWQLNISYLNLTTIGAILILFISTRSETYGTWRGHFGFQLLAKLATTWLLAGAALAAYLIFSHQGAYFSRIWLGLWWIGSYLIALTIRAITLIYLSRQNSLYNSKKRVLAVGSKRPIKELEQKLQNNSWAGYKIQNTTTLNAALALNPEQLEEALNGIDEIWVTTPLKNGLQLNDINYKLGNCLLDIRYIPDVRDVRLLSYKIDQIAGIHAINLSTSPLDGINSAVKRLVDLVLGSILLTLSLPVMCVIAIAIKLTSRGPILFRQKRHGIDGKPIEIYKFRSMHTQDNDDNQRVIQATKTDPRVTPLGVLLRKTSLDELPQFYNVLQGRMSIVGPRPHAIVHNEYYADLVESYMRRHKVKPGITGWAQANGLRGETDTLEKMRKRVEYDLFYIENWSLWFDIEIIMLTLISFLRDKNAY